MKCPSLYNTGANIYILIREWYQKVQLMYFTCSNKVKTLKVKQQQKKTVTSHTVGVMDTFWVNVC